MGRKTYTIDYNTHRTTYILIDAQSINVILPYIMRENVDQEFKDIRALLKENLRNREKYCKVDVSDKAKDVYEMRFTRGNRNDRIYCKEYKICKKRVIIMVELYEGKKSQNIPKNIKQRIEMLGGYDYEIQL